MLKQKVTHFFLLNDERSNPFSGAENHLWELLKGLSLVCNVELLLGVGEVGPVIKRKIAELKAEGVQVSIINKSDISHSKFKYIRIFQEFLAYYKEFKIRKDCILHLHLNTNFIPLAAIIAGHNNIFYSFHNDEPYFTNWNSKLLLKYFVKKFRHVIAITNHVKKHLVENVGLPEDKISVVHYGINPPIIKNIDELKIPELGGIIKLCFVGRLTEQKNLFFFFDCIKKLPLVSLVLFGDGPEKDELITYASKLGIADRIYFYGYLDEASSYIKKFDFLCLPSKWEGLGLVLVEAMYQKVPIIGSDAGAIPEILRYGELGTVISYSNNDRSILLMQELFTNIKLAKQKAIKAFEYAESNYTVAQMVNKTVKLYSLWAR